MILDQCPITSGLPTKMLKDRFLAMCSEKRADQKPYCVDKCRGKKLPAELEFIELNREEPMGAKSGTCDQCGKEGVAILKPCHGKKCCPSCDVLRRGVKNHVDMVRGMLAEFYPEQKTASNEIAATFIAELQETRVLLGGSDHERVPSLAKKIMIKLANLDAMYHDSQEELNELHKRLSETTRELAKAWPLDKTNDSGMAGAIEQACAQVRDFLLQKNASYGNSAADPVRVFSKADPMEQINVRLDDKLSRLIRGGAYPGDNDEQDILGYLILKQAVRIFHAEQARLAA